MEERCFCNLKGKNRVKRRDGKVASSADQSKIEGEGSKNIHAILIIFYFDVRLVKVLRER